MDKRHVCIPKNFLMVSLNLRKWRKNKSFTSLINYLKILLKHLSNPKTHIHLLISTYNFLRRNKQVFEHLIHIPNFLYPRNRFLRYIFCRNIREFIGYFSASDRVPGRHNILWIHRDSCFLFYCFGKWLRSVVRIFLLPWNHQFLNPFFCLLLFLTLRFCKQAVSVKDIRNSRTANLYICWSFALMVDISRCILCFSSRCCRKSIDTKILTYSKS